MTSVWMNGTAAYLVHASAKSLTIEALVLKRSSRLIPISLLVVEEFIMDWPITFLLWNLSQISLAPNKDIASTVERFHCVDVNVIPLVF